MDDILGRSWHGPRVCWTQPGCSLNSGGLKWALLILKRPPNLMLRDCCDVLGLHRRGSGTSKASYSPRATEPTQQVQPVVIFFLPG